MRVLIVGLGSIANKHIKVLREIVKNVELYALRNKKNSSEVQGVENIYSWNETPEGIDFILISNPTQLHYETIEKASDFGVPLFIEKPPLMHLEKADRLGNLLKKKKVKTYSAFNFRFHPLIQFLKKKVKSKRVLEVQAYCGSYLPDWRPGRDYREVYSAKKDLGGGVHLDLIHELDYLLWIFGEPETHHSIFSKVSDLEIDSVDCAHYFLQYKNLNISILLNYYRRVAKRQIEIVFDEDTWILDLLNGSVTNAANEIICQAQFDVLDTYRNQMKYFLKNLEEDSETMNSFQNSLKTLNIAIN